MTDVPPASAGSDIAAASIPAPPDALLERCVELERQLLQLHSQIRSLQASKEREIDYKSLRPSARQPVAEWSGSKRRASIATSAAASSLPFDFKLRRQLTGHTGRVNKCSWGADPRTLASVCSDGHIFVWDAFKGLKKASVMPLSRHVLALALDPVADKLVAAGGLDNAVSLYRTTDPPSDRTSPTVASFPHDAIVFDCSFADASRRVAVACANGEALLWDISTQANVGRFAGHTADATG